MVKTLIILALTITALVAFFIFVVPVDEQQIDYTDDEDDLDDEDEC